MNTNEHTELGDALRFHNWDNLQGNPYIIFNKEGILHLNLQGLNKHGMPEPIGLVLSAGVIIAMSGDYFGGKEIAFKLPQIGAFKNNPNEDSATACERLGRYLIHKSITKEEEERLIHSYERLANHQTKQKEIDAIYAINNSNYIPFSSTLNFYAQQLMLSLQVKHYDEILLRNEAHFTPWSVRVYTIGHHIALSYAELYNEINQCLGCPDYQSLNPNFNLIRPIIDKMDTKSILDLAHRYQALALGMEFFCFHYYTDHFAAGHMSFMGDLRALLPKRFGMWGTLLTNNLHDELNRVTVYTKRAYAQSHDKNEKSIEAGGDGDFDEAANSLNKKACIEGMTASLNDIHQVFIGGKRPTQIKFGGLTLLPDIDNHSNQPEPLILLGQAEKIYYRSDLKHVNFLSPSQLHKAYSDPLNNGYTELRTKLNAFELAFKLRMLPFMYKSRIIAPSVEQLAQIESDETCVKLGTIPKFSPSLYSQPKHLNKDQEEKKCFALQKVPHYNFFSKSKNSSFQSDTQEQPLLNLRS